jgi:hypothetical protein
MLYAAGVVVLGAVCFLVRARLANQWPFQPRMDTDGHG